MHANCERQRFHGERPGVGLLSQKGGGLLRVVPPAAGLRSLGDVEHHFSPLLAEICCGQPDLKSHSFQWGHQQVSCLYSILGGRLAGVARTAEYQRHALVESSSAGTVPVCSFLLYSYEKKMSYVSCETQSW